MNEFFPTIPQNEFSQRVKNLRELMAADGIDLVIGFSNLLDLSTVRYFCNFSPVNESAAIIIPIEGTVTVCSGQASYDYALIQNRLKDSVVKVFPEIGEVSGFEYDFEGQLDFADYFNELKGKYKVKKIALLEKLIFPAVIYNKIRDIFSEAEIVEYDKQFYDLRVIKSENEIECIKKASQIISSTFEEVVPQIEAGMTERYVQGLFEFTALKYGAESTVQAFSPMVATGNENSHISMCRNTLRDIKESEILNLAAGCCYEGYNGIICFPYVLGEIPQEITDAVKCARDALNIAADKMKPGTTADVILNAYMDYLKRYGYIDYCPYGSLHSTGLLECEAPVFSVANRREIKENMTMCIDAYFKGMEWGSFRIEDTYIITKEGAKRLTTFNDHFLPKVFKV